MWRFRCVVHWATVASQVQLTDLVWLQELMTYWNLSFYSFFFQLLTSIIQYWIQTVDLISKTQSQQNNSCRFQNKLVSLPSIHPSIQKSRSNKTINSMSSIIRYCMCSIGVPAAPGVCMFSTCWCWFPLGFLQIQRHTWQVNWRLWVSVHMNICVCHLCDGLERLQERLQPPHDPT